MDFAKEKLRSARPVSSGLGTPATFCTMSERFFLRRRAMMWSRCCRHGGMLMFTSEMSSTTIFGFYVGIVSTFESSQIAASGAESGGS